MGKRWKRVKAWWGRGAPLRGSNRRGYDGAEPGRRTDGWLPLGSGTDPNAILNGRIQRLRDTARELVRNTSEASSGVSVFVSNLVGDGLVPTSTANVGDLVLPPDDYGRPSETVNQRADAVWKEWAEVAGSDGQQCAYGIQGTAARAIFESGEVLLRQRRRRLTDALPVPVQVELLESDLLDHGRTGRVGRNNRVVQGVEMDARGRRVAYWLHPEHPGSLIDGTRGSTLTSKRIGARWVAHAFEPLRPGQVRGVTFLAPVMLRMMQFADYSEAELERKRLEASIFASVDGLEGDDFAFQPQGTEDGQAPPPPRATTAQGDVLEEIESGQVVYTPAGASINVHAPASIGGVSEYRRQELTAIASGMRMVYTLLTGDLSGTNYSSIRAGLIEFRRMIRAFRRLVFVRNVCRPMRRWCIEAAIDAGRLPFLDPSTGLPIQYRARWTSPAFESVDRLKDATADALLLANMLVSHGEAMRERGDVPEDMLADVINWRDKLVAAGLSPAYMQSASQAPADEPDQGDDDDESDSQA